MTGKGILTERCIPMETNLNYTFVFFMAIWKYRDNFSNTTQALQFHGKWEDIVSGALLFNVIENPVLELPLLWEKNGGDQLR